MSSSSNKKLFLFYVLEILKEETDEKHLLTQDQIAERIYKRHGVELNRKTVGANLQDLEELGYEVEKVGGQGCYLITRDFEPSEINYLIDAVYSSKVIPSKQAKELCQKLSSFLSNYEAKERFKYVSKAGDVSRTNKQQMFYSLDTINEAIKQNKKIEFTYVRNYINTLHESEKYVVSPYFFINSQGKYYLVSYSEKYKELTNFKLEKIANITILEDKRVDVKTIKGYANGIDREKYANENIYMFSGDVVNATLKFNSEIMIDYALDWFDSETRIYEKAGDYYADVKASEKALIYWCLQYGESVELISPQKTREKIKTAIETMSKKYK